MRQQELEPTAAEASAPTSPSERMRTILGDELERRRRRNRRYSLRSLARAVGLSSAFLSHFLAGRRNLGLGTAIEVVSRLGWDRSAQRHCFHELVELELASRGRQHNF